MLISVAVGLLSTVMLSAPPVLAINEPANPTLSAKLKMALTHLDFWNSLSNDDFIFDFNKQSQNPWKPGSVLNANVATWPLLVAGNQAIAQLNIGACSLLAPHVHPHATNIVVLVAGSVRTYMRAENGAIDRQTVLTPGKLTYFPRASFHSMVNEGCTNAQLYAFLDSNDPGTLNLAQAIWSAGSEVGNSVLPMVCSNGSDWNTTGNMIPAVGTGVQELRRDGECWRRCFGGK